MTKISKSDKTNELRKRLLVILTIIILYLIGLMVPLLGVEPDTGQENAFNAQRIVTTMLNGANNQKGFFALGIMPYINAMIFVQCFTIFRTSESRARISQQRIQRLTGILTFFLGFFFAMNKTSGWDITIPHVPYMVARMLVIGEMLIGIAILFVMLEFNKKHGVGETMPLIVINIIGGLKKTVGDVNLLDYKGLLILCLFVIVATFIIENVFIKIPVQRVSINNVHAEKNYIAYKLNIVGVMPVMFGTAVFMLPQLLLKLWIYIDPDNITIREISMRMNLTDSLGVHVYLCIIILLVILLAFLLLNPWEMAKNLRKSGDCIVGVPSGKKTSQYLVRRIFALCIFSGLFQSGCMAVSLQMSLHGILPSEVAMLPMNAMMLVSFACSIFFELRSYYRFDGYRFFL
ncbi:MAG: preprotein translocase subunit SecY [Lachnospiraceae bacterium]|nr:preprotein translocase subunit SecY [Lachnospiraceae bacterium]